jgi:uncharacterized protein YndB with AHSA1/START domain
MKRWLGCADGFTIPDEIEVDLRVGGCFRIAMQSPQGDLHVATGTYKEVNPPEKLVFTWTWIEGGMDIGETLVTVELQERVGQTELSLKHENFPSEEARKSHLGGWSGGLDKLEKLL